MPLLKVQLSTKPNADQSTLIASKLTALTKTHLKKKPHLTAVTIQHIDPENWFINSTTLTRSDTTSFSLQICITDGTNTPQQIDDYIKAVFSTMTKILPITAEESYIVVEHIPASHWGYGGKTQQERTGIPA